MREQDVHHGPVPGHQLGPQCPAGAAWTSSHSQRPAGNPKPYPEPGTEARCNSSIFPPAQKDISGWTISWLWLLKAVLSLASMACSTSLQAGGPSWLESRSHPDVSKALSLQNHPCPMLEGDFSGLLLWLVHAHEALGPQHKNVLPLQLNHKSCFSPCAWRKRRRGD